MPISAVTADRDQLTLTVVADFPASLERLWGAYVDPRQIEKFWGPVEFPATFLQHEPRPGGRSLYRMTGPDGSEHYGYWEWQAVVSEAFFEVRDGFAHADGSPDTELPSMRMVYAFADTPGGSRLVVTTHFESQAEFEQLTEMGMEEGMRSAMSQIDAVLAEPTPG